MKWTALFPIVLVLLCLPSRPAAAAPHYLRHALTVTLAPEDHRLEVEDILTLAPAPRQLTLMLHEGAQLSACRSGVNDLPCAQNRDQLRIDLPPGLYQDRATLRLRYRLDLPAAEMPASAHDEDPGYGISLALGPRGGFFGAGSRWMPQLPGSRPAVDLTLLLPPTWEAVTDGRLVERELQAGQRRVRWQMQLNRPGLTLAAGPWGFQQSEGAVPVMTFFSDANSGLSRTYTAAARRYLEEYTALLGPYPFPKFAIAENYFPSGFGFPSWTLLGGQVLRLPFILDSSLPHEIVHNWYGNGVLLADTGGNWSEGLTSYLADYRQAEKASAEAAADYRLKTLRDFSTLVNADTDLPLAYFAGRTSATERAVGYGKALMVFHMLRRTIGDDAFFATLRDLTRTRMNRETSWDDLTRAFSYRAGRDLTPFFHQWVERPGAPLLALRAVQQQRTASGWLVSGTLAQEGRPWTIDIPLVVHTAAGRQPATVALAGSATRFSVETAARPVRLDVDPEAQIMRRLHSAEIPPITNSIRGSERLLVVLSRRLDPETRAAAQGLVAALRQGGAAVAGEQELTPQALRGYDVLFLGPPANPALFPARYDALELTATGFRLDQTLYDRPEDALFAVIPHPGTADRAMALYWPLSPMAADSTLRKIPHYGKYSFLAFRNGVNRAKGTWPVASSPLIHLFPATEAKP